MPLRVDKIPTGYARLVALLAAPLLLAILLRVVGRDPALTFWAIIRGGFATPAGLTGTLIHMTPIFLCALAVSIPAKAGLFNIGGEGQLYCGALAATAFVLFVPWWPQQLTIPAIIVVAMLGGAFWGMIPGLLRGWFSVNEVLVSLMLNYVAIAVVQYLVHGPWQDPSALGWPYTIDFPDWAILPTLGKSNIHLGLLLGLLAAGLTYVVLRKTTWGFSLRVIESNPRTAQYLKIGTARYIIALMAIGGALAALAGLGEVSVIQHRLQPDMSPGYGYTGLLVAWLARNHPLVVALVAFLIGGLYSGADALQVTAGLPSATVDIFIGFILLAVLVEDFFRRNNVSRQVERAQ